jgi:hypothetical protein
VKEVSSEPFRLHWGTRIESNRSATRRTQQPRATPSHKHPKLTANKPTPAPSPRHQQTPGQFPVPNKPPASSPPAPQSERQPNPLLRRNGPHHARRRQLLWPWNQPKPNHDTRMF